MTTEYDPLYLRIAEAEHFREPWLLKAIAEVETGQDPTYRRATRGWRRYWLRYTRPQWPAHHPLYDADPHLIAARYGLMAVPLGAAMQMGWPADEDPAGLLEPEVGCRYGCRWLANRLARYAKASVSGAVAAYGTPSGMPQLDGSQFSNQRYVDRVMRLALEIRGHWRPAETRSAAHQYQESGPS